MRSGVRDENGAGAGWIWPAVLLREVEISRSCSRRAGLAQIAPRGVAHVEAFAPAQLPAREELNWQ